MTPEPSATNKPPTSVLVIMNPASGQGDADKRRQRVEARLREAGVPFEIRETEGEGDALRWARGTDADLVIVAGGDGTVMEAMSGLIENEREVPLAQLPAGTANLLARALTVPVDLDEALDLALGGVAVKMDVGYLPQHERYFALVAGAGWDARMIEDAPREIKDRFGFLAYLLSGFKALFTLRSADVTLEVDGESHRLRAHTVMLVNVGEVAGTRLRMGSPHDGKLDLTVLAPHTPWGLLRLATRLISGNFENTRDLRHFAAERVAVRTSPELEFQVDGEPLGHTPFHAEVVPSGALLVVPAAYAEEKELEPWRAPAARAAQNP